MAWLPWTGIDVQVAKDEVRLLAQPLGGPRAARIEVEDRHAAAVDDLRLFAGVARDRDVGIGSAAAGKGEHALAVLAAAKVKPVAGLKLVHAVLDRLPRPGLRAVAGLVAAGRGDKARFARDRRRVERLGHPHRFHFGAHPALDRLALGGASRGLATRDCLGGGVQRGLGLRLGGLCFGPDIAHFFEPEAADKQRLFGSRPAVELESDRDTRAAAADLEGHGCCFEGAAGGREIDPVLLVVRSVDVQPAAGLARLAVLDTRLPGPPAQRN
jgi:hypothetical protein